MGEVGRFLLMSWPDGSVVFDRNTGDTHAFDSYTYALFNSLQSGISAMPMLFEQVQAGFPEIPLSELKSRFGLALDQLQKLGFLKDPIH